jgi:hypothetical protein
MIVARILGWIFVAAALAIAGTALALWLSGQNFALVAGQLWYQLSPGSLKFIQNILPGFLWNHGLLPLLQGPVYQALGFGFLGFFLAGVALVALFRRRDRRRRFN